MKKLLFSILILLQTELCFSQSLYPFPLQNTTWSEYQIVDSIFGYYCIGTLHYGYYNDTLINSNLYSKMYVNNNNSSAFDVNTADYFGALRDVNGKIFIVPADSTNELLMYDFSLQQIGDTTEIFFPCNVQFTLNGIDTIVGINGNSVRELTLEVIGSLEEEIWIEGYGNILGFNAPISYDCLSQYTYIYSQNSCFFENGNTYIAPDYFSMGYQTCNCGNYWSIEDVISNKLIIFPNPTSEKLTITFSSNLRSENLFITIFDFSGKVILHQYMQSEMELNIANLTNGIYLIRIEDGVNFWNEKIIVEK